MWLAGKRLAGVVVFSALGQGILRYLKQLGIDVPGLVAEALTMASDPMTLDWLSWVLAGLFGLAVLIVWERARLGGRIAGLLPRKDRATEKSPAATPAPIPLLRPVHWLIHELVDELRREHDRDVRIGEAIEELRRRAEAGTVVLWGRAGGDGLPVAIPAGYWRWWTLDKNAAVRRQPVDTVPLLRGDPGQPLHTAVSAAAGR